MCYIQLSLRVNNKRVNTDIDDLIKSVAIGEMDSNKNGSWVKSGERVTRSMDRATIEQALLDADTNGLMVHHRLATTGAVDESNVHGWAKAGWEFMHNGWTGDGDRNSVPSDSLLFFRKLLPRLKAVKTDKAIAKAIQDISESSNFRGRAVLYNARQNKAFLFGDFHLALINENYIVISSVSQDWTEIRRPFEVAGLEFENGIAIPFNVIEQTLDGIYTLTGLGTNNTKFKKIADFEQYSYSGGKYSDWQEYKDKAEFDDYNGTYTAGIDETGRVNDGVEVIDEYGSYIKTATSDYGYYTSDNQFHLWDSTIEGDEFLTDSDIAKRDALREQALSIPF